MLLGALRRRRRAARRAGRGGREGGARRVTLERRRPSRRAGLAATRCEVARGRRRSTRTPGPGTTSNGSSARPGCTRTSARWPTTCSPGWPRPRGGCTACPAADVHFHEVGALDAIADVVGVCAGVVHLGLPTGRGLAGRAGRRVGDQSQHGRLPVPAPAVVELLRGVPSYGGPVGRRAVHARPAPPCWPRSPTTGARSRAMAVAQVGRRARGPAIPRATPTCCGCWSATGFRRLDQRRRSARVLERRAARDERRRPRPAALAGA